MAQRDPILQPQSSSSGKPKNASAGRIRSISGGGPNFTKDGSLKGFPNSDSPYKGSK